MRIGDGGDENVAPGSESNTDHNDGDGGDEDGGGGDTRG